MREVTLGEWIIATAEACGTPMGDVGVKMLLLALERHPKEAALMALERCRNECFGKFSQAAVLARLEDGWPDPEIAFGTALRCSSGDVAQIVCDEIMAAWGDAAPALEVGDKYGFRQTFLASYTRRRNEARAEKRAPRRWVSGAIDRERVTREGVESGLLPSAALDALPPPAESTRALTLHPSEGGRLAIALLPGAQA